jgi:hypothetical protein
MQQVFIDGREQGAGGGGGGGGGWSADWTTLYDRDFTQLVPASVKPGSDGNFTLDGKTAYARNVSRMAALDVGLDGLELTLGAVSESADYYGSTLVGPAVEWRIAQFFEGTPFENRDDVELMFRFLLDWSGTPNSSVFEHRTVGLRTSNHDINRRIQILQGGIPGNTVSRRLFTESAGQLAYGATTLSSTDLAYTPNVIEARFTENYLRVSYSASGSAQIDDLLVSAYALERPEPSRRLVKKSGLAQEGMLFFGHGKSGGVAGLTSIMLKRLQAFARFSPRGIGVFVP